MVKCVDLSKVELMASGQDGARDTRRARRKAFLVPPLLMLNWTRSPRKPLLRQRMSRSLVPDLVGPSCRGLDLRGSSHLVVDCGMELVWNDVTNDGRVVRFGDSDVGRGLGGP
jgi:hypothetical protein